MELLCCHDATECNLPAISQSADKLKGYFNNDDDSEKGGNIRRDRSQDD